MDDVACDKCGCPADEPGGLLVSPPDSDQTSLVLHLCVHCYAIILEDILGDAAADHLPAPDPPRPLPVTFGDAKYGAVVLLADGRQGPLQYIARRTRIATVRIDGRHVRVPADQILGVVTRGDEPAA